MKKNILSFLFQFTILAALVTLPARAVTHGDVNGDGEVNIADVNTIINAILSANVSGATDVNGDGEVNIADVNSVINIILNPNPTPPDEGTDPPGLYMGITGFNQQLYTKDISMLNRATKGNFTGFVSSLSTRDATVLYYAVDKSLDALNAAPYPINLRNVAIVTFTDGLDQGSLMLTDQGYISDTQYASVLSSRIGNMTVHGCPLQAYSIGLKGSDVTNDAMFMSNLQSLASSDDNVALVNNMEEVKAKFQTIADNLAKTSYSYSHTLTLTDSRREQRHPHPLHLRQREQWHRRQFPKVHRGHLQPGEPHSDQCHLSRHDQYQRIHHQTQGHQRHFCHLCLRRPHL